VCVCAGGGVGGWVGGWVGDTHTHTHTHTHTTALVQIMHNPAIKPVYETLLEASCDIYLMPAQLLLPYGYFDLNPEASALNSSFKGGLASMTPS